MFPSLAETYRLWHRWFRSGPSVAQEKTPRSHPEDVATVKGKGSRHVTLSLVRCYTLFQGLTTLRGNLNKQGLLTGGLKYIIASKLIGPADAICLRYMQKNLYEVEMMSNVSHV